MTKIKKTQNPKLSSLLSIKIKKSQPEDPVILTKINKWDFFRVECYLSQGLIRADSLALNIIKS